MFFGTPCQNTRLIRFSMPNIKQDRESDLVLKPSIEMFTHLKRNMSRKYSFSIFIALN